MEEIRLSLYLSFSPPSFLSLSCALFLFPLLQAEAWSMFEISTVQVSYCEPLMCHLIKSHQRDLSVRAVCGLTLNNHEAVINHPVDPIWHFVCWHFWCNSCCVLKKTCWRREHSVFQIYKLLHSLPPCCFYGNMKLEVFLSVDWGAWSLEDIVWHRW